MEKICARIFTGTFFKKANSWKQLKCPLKGDLLWKILKSYRADYYITVEGDKVDL